MMTISTTAGVDASLAAGSPVAIGVSGGKDSCALALALNDHLDTIGHGGPRMLVHSDLGRVEWTDSHPTCERLAAATGLELVTVRRKAGGLMERWRSRWENNVERYLALSCVKLILPWSTAAMRFCTSELKVDVITSELSRRFAGRHILSASGIRRDESAQRAKAPVAKPQPKLARSSRKTTGTDWHPIIEWTTDDVFAYLQARGFRLHEAYTRFGSSRVSCAFCILASQADLKAAADCEANADIYREMVGLEAESTFAFRAGAWLGDVAPHLLDPETRAALAEAKEGAAGREAAEALIPADLLYTKGWPTRVPTPAEAESLCEVRRRVAAAVGLEPTFTEPDDLVGRYEELMREKAGKAGPRPVVARPMPLFDAAA